MKIASSTISLDSQHVSVEQHSVRESLRMWQGGARPDFEGSNGRGLALGRQSALVAISEAAKQAASKAEAIETAVGDIENDPTMQLLLRMLEAMTGRPIKHLGKIHAGEEPPQGQRLGWGLEYDRQISHYEAEVTTFSAEGVIKTADGKEISFSLELAMSREYYEESTFSLRAGDAVFKDPLTINFDGQAAQLTETKFAFDIDSDGTQDDISFVAPGSGFLALDRNGNGTIDDGSELFGTQSGNGFADLAQYDSDGNLWIDENDAVFDDLRIWSKDANGQDSLISLARSGVGALYLGNISTPFSLNTATNQSLGMIRASGVYLTESGSVGMLQQIDLTV
jgi:hypothetical protein